MVMYVKALVTPDSKKESLTETSKDRLAISVREPARQNLANSRVVELVARHYSVPRGSVRIISGHHSPSKLLSVDIEGEGGR